MSDHLVLEDSETTVGAWLSAVAAIDKAEKPVRNLVYTITDPGRVSGADKAVRKIFDNFALHHGFNSSETVANTIFPLDTYLAKRNDDPADFYDYYIETILPRVRKRWGTYFERMTIRYNADGTVAMKGNRRVNPLDTLVDKLKCRVEGTKNSKTHYELGIDDIAFELATYNPTTDGNYQVGGPCLSHLSFKVHEENEVGLTAFYRSHWYIERALGNLIGLARLQQFVASSAGTSAGPLTIIAAEAVLDLTASRVGSKRKASETRAMIEACQKAES